MPPARPLAAHGPRRSRLPVVAGIAIAPALAACGPSPYEAGTAALLATPVAVLVGYLVLWGLHALWRRVRPEHRVPRRPALAVASAALALGLAALAFAPPTARVGEWIGPAIVTYGPSWLAVFFLTWRIAFAVRPARAASVALGVATGLMVAPALVLIATDGFPELAFFLWIYPGIYGIPPLVMALGLFVEAAIRAGGPVEPRA